MDIKNKRIFILSILLIMCLIVLYIKNGHNWGDDFAMYLNQSQAILNNNLHKLYQQSLISSHLGIHVGPEMYPHGFPLLLAIPLYVLGLHFVGLKIFCSAFLVLSFVACYMYYSKFINDKWLLLGGLFSFFGNYLVLMYSDAILSEFPYLFFSLILFFEIVKNNKLTIYKFILLIILIFLALQIRSFAHTLFLALMYRIWIEKGYFKSYKWIIGGSMFYIFLVLVSSKLIPYTDSKHLSMLLSISVEEIIEQIKWYFLGLSEFIFPIHKISSSISLTQELIVIGQIVLSAGFIFTSFYGFIYSKITNKGVFLIYGVSNIILIVAFPSGGYFDRYLFPIAPLLLVGFVLGLAILIKNKIVLRYTALTWILITLSVSGINGFNHQNKFTNDSYNSSSIMLYKWVKGNTSKSDMISFFKPRALRFFTGRNAANITPEFNEDLKQINFFIDFYDVQKEQIPTYFKQIDSVGKFRIYKNLSFK